MIKSIEIKNFKCFDNLRLPLSKLTILAGANAAGKSTVMQALLLAEGVAAGGPKALISQNRTEVLEGDFLFHIQWDEAEVTFTYKIDKLVSLKLAYNQSGSIPDNQLVYLNAERMGPRSSRVLPRKFYIMARMRHF